MYSTMILAGAATLLAFVAHAPAGLEAAAAGAAATTKGNAVRCTYHDYEGLIATYGEAADNAPGWCGIRYSGLVVPHIVAVDFMGASSCNKCLRIWDAKGKGPSVYALAVDRKGSPGLDLAQTVFRAAFPGQNPLNPQQCNWEVVDPSHCEGFCFASPQECTLGKRNLLPAYLLPPITKGPRRSTTTSRAAVSRTTTAAVTTVRKTTTRKTAARKTTTTKSTKRRTTKTTKRRTTKTTKRRTTKTTKTRTTKTTKTRTTATPKTA